MEAKGIESLELELQALVCAHEGHPWRPVVLHLLELESQALVSQQVWVREKSPDPWEEHWSAPLPSRLSSLFVRNQCTPVTPAQGMLKQADPNDKSASAP